MKFANTNEEAFVTLFGQEVFEAIQHHEVTVYLATDGMFPLLDGVGKVSGCVVPVNPETLELFGEGSELFMILYPDNIKDESKALPENLRDRFVASTVLHELMHVKQVNDGRLVIKKFGISVWEGIEYKLDANGYVSYPWEKEAYLAQFTYLLNSQVLAQVAYDNMTTNYNPETI